MNRKTIKDQIKTKGITGVLKVPKNTLTAKQRRFAEGIALQGLTASDAYRQAYNTKGLPATVNPHASRLANTDKIKATIEALALANEAMAYADAESIRKLVIQSLIQTVIDPDIKPATKVAAAKVLGQVTEVAAFTERREITHVRDSGAIREQILDQLKTMVLNTADAETIDADSLLNELAGSDPHWEGMPQAQNEPHSRSLHTIPPNQSQENSDSRIPSEEISEDDISDNMAFMMLNTETPPLSSEMEEGGGDIFGKNDEVAK